MQMTEQFLQVTTIRCAVLWFSLAVDAYWLLLFTMFLKTYGK